MKQQRNWKKMAGIATGSMFGGIIVGILLWGGFNWGMEMTNHEQFCISCHEMETTPYAELQETVHYNNRTGVRATCPDCHVPKEWIYKIKRKIQASNELYHKFITKSVDTPEKFEKHRLEMALREWTRMKSTDSRECRNCHKFEFMDYTYQEARAVRRHEEGFAAGQTCIECHKGIAHRLPQGALEGQARSNAN